VTTSLGVKNLHPNVHTSYGNEAAIMAKSETLEVITFFPE
jgi:hypothetical protein